jgi:hypothetical protein
MAIPEIHLEITRYLKRLLDQKLLQQMSVDQAMSEVRKWVPGAQQLSESDLRSLVLGFYLSQSIYAPGAAPIYSPDSSTGKLVDEVKKAITLVMDGVPIVENLTGKITISAKGLTATSKRGGPTVNLGWTGTLQTEITGGNFKLKNSLSRSGWSISLSYPKDAPVLDGTKVGAVFGAAGDAISRIMDETFMLSDVQDVRPKVGLISGTVEPIADAIGLVQGIKARPRLGLSVSASVGSPAKSPGQAGQTGGIEGFLTLTYSW